MISEKNVEGFFYPTHLNSSWSEWFLDRQTLGGHLNRSHLQALFPPVGPPLAIPTRPRLPQFVTFNTLDNIMTVDLNLAFPFMRVPVTNTTNIANLARDFMRVSNNCFLLVEILFKIIENFSVNDLLSTLI